MYTRNCRFCSSRSLTSIASISNNLTTFTFTEAAHATNLSLRTRISRDANQIAIKPSSALVMIAMCNEMP